MYGGQLFLQWNHFVICVTFVILGLSMVGQFVYAERANLWVPSEMIQGISYEGLLVLEKPIGGTFLLTVENSEGVTVDPFVTILPNSNHGIFKITSYRDGNLTLYTEVDGDLLKTTSRVYSTGGKPHGLKIILPANTTNAETITGFVIATDVNGAPVLVDTDIEIILDSSTSVHVPNSITMVAGTYYVGFKAHIHGTGMIFASTPSLEHDEYEIKKIHNDVTMQMAAAPTISMENSQTMVVVWFEKDGKPFKPPYVVDAYVSSSNTSIARIEKISGPADNDIARIPMIDGVGFKQLNTGDAGTTIITASVQGFGTAQTSLTVGAAQMDTAFEFLTNVSGSSPHVVAIWAYPRIGTSEFTGVVSFYEIEYSNLTDTINDNTNNKINPIKLNGQRVLISSTGLSHTDSLLMIGGVTNEQMPHAIKFDIRAENSGTYNIFAAGPNLERSQTKITSTIPYEETIQLVIIPMPIFSNLQQPLAMVCVVDSNGFLLNVNKMLGSNALVNVSVGDVSETLTFSEESCVTIYGKIDSATPILALMKNMEPAYKEVRPLEIDTTIRFDVSKRAHITEEVPFVIHKVDSFGIPFAKTEADFITGNVQVNEQRLLVYDENVIAHTEFGTLKSHIELFTNQMRFEVLPKSTIVRTGQNVVTVIDSDVEGFDVNVNSLVPVKKVSEGVFVFTPNNEGVFPVVFSAEKEGYSPAVSEFSFTVRKIAELNVNAIGNDGKRLSVPIQSSNNVLPVGLKTPQILEVKPGLIELDFPMQYTINEHNYRLLGAVHNDQEFHHVNGSLSIVINSDSNLTVQYEKIVTVNVLGAVGSGIYSYGDTVVLSVPPRDVYLFLVRDVFDGWEGIDDNLQTVSFVAVSDVAGYAMYKTDYSGLMIVVSIIVTGVVAYMVLRKRLLVRNLQNKTVQENSLNDW